MSDTTITENISDEEIMKEFESFTAPATNIAPKATGFFKREDDLPVDLLAEDEPETKDDPTEDKAKPVVVADAPIASKSRSFKPFIEKEILRGFDDGKDADEYNDNEIEELLRANLKVAGEEFHNEKLSLYPDELKQLMKYVEDGGEDLTEVFMMMGTVREQRELDLADPDNHEAIVRNYLMLEGTEGDVIDDLVGSYKDRKGKLSEMATKYKPLLDTKLKDALDQELKEQENQKRRNNDLVLKYTTSVKQALEKNELGGVKIDAKLKTDLTTGMTSLNHKSIISGRPVNEFSHLLEQYQFGEKQNHALVLEALWLLKDPEGYKKSLKSVGSTEEAAKTQKMLKREEATKTSSTGEESTEDATRQTKSLKPRSIFDTVNNKK